jgi:hypothetical protein
MSSDAVPAYDDPNLSAHEFLLAVMRDQSLDLHYRMFAADGLCRAGLGHISTIGTLDITLTGGMPDPATLAAMDFTKLGVVNDPSASGFKPATRKHRGFRLVKSS